MKMMHTAAAAAGSFLLFALLGCSKGDASPAAASSAITAPGERASSHSFSFAAAGARATSHMTKRVLASGDEVLEASTELWPAGAAHPMVLVESAQIAAPGRLVAAAAELRGGPRASELVRSVSIDAARGSVSVKDAEGERSWQAPADHPWMYRGLFADTPVAASNTAIMVWVARRAAQAGTKVRDVDVGARESHLTVPEQVVFKDGAVDLVVLGDEVGETDAELVRSLAWKPLRAAADAAQAPGLFCEPDPS